MGDDFKARVLGRARFCRGRGEIKTPELLDEAADRIEALEARVRELEQGWQPIETAPRDKAILLWGLLSPHPDNKVFYVNLHRPIRASGYWDNIDDLWCVTGATCKGPWFEPTHWRPLPQQPEAQG